MAVSNVELRVDARNAVQSLKKTNDASKQLNDTLGKTKAKAATATGNIQRMGVAFRTTLGPIVALYGAVNFLNRSLDVASQRQVNVAKLTNGLKNLGRTQSDLERLTKAADEFGRATLFDQEDATQAFALLTSFRKIGVDSYERVTKAAADLATITGGDLKSAQLQLAKALEDPTKQVTALARAGTVFTEQQKEQIKTLQESGRILEAQNIILSEIETQYGGAAEAAGSAGFAGALDTLGEATRDFQEQLVAGTGTINLAETAIYKAADAIDAATESVRDIQEILSALDRIIRQLNINADGLAGVFDVINQAVIRAIPGLEGMIWAYEQLIGAAKRFNDQQAGPRNFGADYASQERALFEAAGGWTPYKPMEPDTTTTRTKTSKSKKAGKTDAEREAERLARIAEASANRVRSLQEQTLLAAALTKEERIQFERQIQIANILANNNDLNKEQLQTELQATLALYEQQDATRAITEENERQAELKKQRDEEEAKRLKKLQEQERKRAEELRNLYQGIGDTISNGVVEALQGAVRGTTSLAEAATNMLNRLADQMFQLAANMLFFGNITGTLGAGQGVLGSLFGGFMANGGTVSGGKSYIVGERGPELFTPGRTGSIAPSGSFGEANVTINVDASGSSVEGKADQAAQLGKALSVAVQQELVKQKRPGGILAS